MISDLTFLNNEGWGEQIKRHLRYGGKLLGICGGLQMLGTDIFDPDGVESKQTQCKGLGFC